MICMINTTKTLDIIQNKISWQNIMHYEIPKQNYSKANFREWKGESKYGTPLSPTYKCDQITDSASLAT